MGGPDGFLVFLVSLLSEGQERVCVCVCVCVCCVYVSTQTPVRVGVGYGDAWWLSRCLEQMD